MVQMHYIAGNASLVDTTVRRVAVPVHDAITPITCLRINKRMRLEEPQLEAVHARMNAE